MAAEKTKQKEVDILWQLKKQSRKKWTYCGSWKNKAERIGWQAEGRQRWIAGGLEGQVAE